MALTLIVLNGPGKGRVFELDGQQPELIGRAAPKLRIPDTETSRRHAEIRYEKETWIIRDLGSTNGTYVNGRRLTGLTELEEGDQILVGRVLLVVGQILAEGEDAAPVTSDEAAVASAQPERPGPGGSLEDEEAIEPPDLGLPADEAASVADIAAPPPPTPSAARVLAEDGDEDDFDLADLDAFEFGGQSEGPADDDAAMALDEPDDAASEEERGYLAVNPDVMEFAEEVVRKERAEPTLEDEGALPTDEEDDADSAAHAADEATGLLSVDADEVAPGDAADIEPAEAPAQDATEAASEEDPLAQLAAENADDADNPWPDLDLSLDEPEAASGPSEARPSAPPTVEDEDDAAFAFDVTDDEEEDAGEEGEPVGKAPPAAPSPTTSAADEDDGDAADTGSGTGLLHHVGLPGKDQTGEVDEAWDEEDASAGSAAASLVDFDDEDELDGDLLTDTAADAQRHTTSPSESGERGIDLASIVPSEDRDEGPTTIINEAVQTHTPYEQRQAESGGGVPPEHWVAPARRHQLAQRVEPVEPQLPPPPSKQRRGLLAVLLSCLVLAGGAGGLWYADQAGYVDLPLPSTAGDAQPRSAATELPDNWRRTASATPAADARQPRSAATDVDPALVAPLERPDPVFRDWSLGEAPPEMALTSAPRLLGEQVLQGRVGEPPQPPPEPSTVADTTSEVTPAEETEGAKTGEADAVVPASTVSADTTADEAAEAAEESPAPDATAAASTQVDEPAESVGPPAPASEAVVTDGEDAPIPAATPGRRVAFVVNASGSVLDTITQLVNWTHRAVGQLQPQDEFTVIFFRRGEALEPPPAGLKQASAEAKAHVRTWTDLAEGNLFPTGQSDPFVALQRALDLGVDEIYLLSDDSLGRGMTGEEAAEALDLMQQLVEGRSVRIHTVQFFYSDPQNMLERMAERFGGTYRFVKPDQPTGPDPLEVLNNFSAASSPPPSAQ